MADSITRLPVSLAQLDRIPNDILQRQSEWFGAHPLLSPILNSVQEMILITNDHRQIVYANQNALEFTGYKQLKDVIGLRSGEILRCRNAEKTEFGCGTSQFCQYCGAARALMSAINGVATTEECHIAATDLANSSTLDLRVNTAPVTLNGVDFVVFSITDISDRNRRRQLERIFFHDVMNTAGIIRNTAEMMVDEKAYIKEAGELLYRTTKRLVDQIESQRELTAIENREYTPVANTVVNKTLLQELLAEYAELKVAKGKHVKLDPATRAITFTIDRTQLARVLGNMIKNALESSQEGETITLGSQFDDSWVDFWVHNPAVMPEAVQAQVFNRSFSTKGAGRGLGTYSMRLLSETYLEGEVSFVSKQGAGTLFRARFPRYPSYAAKATN